jgi:hypothetical protein
MLTIETKVLIGPQVRIVDYNLVADLLDNGDTVVGTFFFQFGIKMYRQRYRHYQASWRQGSNQ